MQRIPSVLYLLVVCCIRGNHPFLDNNSGWFSFNLIVYVGQKDMEENKSNVAMISRSQFIKENKNSL